MRTHQQISGNVSDMVAVAVAVAVVVVAVVAVTVGFISNPRLHLVFIFVSCV